MARNTYKREMIHYFGPGGIDCPCCGPSPRSRERILRSYKRAAKQVARQALKREMEE